MYRSLEEIEQVRQMLRLQLAVVHPFAALSCRCFFQLLTDGLGFRVSGLGGSGSGTGSGTCAGRNHSGGLMSDIATAVSSAVPRVPAQAITNTILGLLIITIICPPNPLNHH